MTTAARRKGASFETDIVKYVRSIGMPAERLRLTGAADEGDVAIQDVGVTILVEAKATAQLDVSGFLREAKVEAANYAKARGLDPDTVWGVVVWKRRNQPISEAAVITTLGALLE